MRQRRTLARRLGVLAAVLLILAGGSAAAVPPAAGLSSTVVISQVYGGGGQNGAPYRNDFVELFNRGTSTVSLAGWSVQYASATGTGTFAANPVTLLTGSLAPGQHYLVQMTSGGGFGEALPAPDATGSVNIAVAGGKVVLASTTTGLACNGGSVPCTPEQLALMVDLIGWGTANFFEGAVGPTTSVTTAALRGGGGYAETDNNAADFSAVAPDPRNTASPLTTPPAITLHPVDMTVDDGQEVTFSAEASGSPAPSVRWQESTDGGSTWIDVAGATDRSLTFTATAPQNGRLYRAAFTNIAATVATDAAALTVIPPALVISQVYGGGGEDGATFKNDFIELFNRGTTTVSLAGWSVQYAATTGVDWSRTDLSGAVAPGQYYLIQEAQGAGGGDDLPAPDAVGSIAMDEAAGKVVLVAGQTTIPGGTASPTGPSIVDVVGYGAGTDCFEGSAPAPTLSYATAALRDGGGWVDTDDNGADFSAGAPEPRTTASPLNLGAPVIAIGAPAGDQVLTGTSTTVGGTASDPGGSVVFVDVCIRRLSDDFYWTGSTWDSVETWLRATGTTDWTYDWTFDPPSQDGSPSYTIVARATDDRDNTDTFTLTGVTVDNTAPGDVGLAIAGGAAYTASRDVTLTLSASGATRMRFSNDGSTWSAWEPYAASKSWTLSAGDGEKTVAVQFADEAGNVAGADDTIILDVTAPGDTGLAIAGGAIAVNKLAVGLNCGATGATRMRFSNDGLTWSAWEPYAVSKSWTLSAGDGEKTVAVQFADEAGNVAGAEDTIILDTEKPTPTGTKAVSVRRGTRATLRYRIKDPAPNAGRATVRIVVRRLDGKTAKTVALKNRPVGKALKYRFVCNLRKGRYRVAIFATDAAGNRQTKVARTTLTVT